MPRLGHLVLRPLAAGALLLAGCSVEKAPAPPAPPVVARVNGEAITAAEVAKDLSRVKEDGGSLALRSEQELDKVRQRFLDQRIRQTLLLQAAKTHHIDAGEDEVQRALLRMRADYPGHSFEAYLADKGIPLSELKREIHRQLVIRHLLADQVNARVAVTAAEVEAAYHAHPKRYQEPARVHCLQIVVKTQEEAQRLLKALRHHQKFADLARKYSLGPEGATGGDLGWFSHDQMPAPIADACFSLPVGRLSGVVESPYGYHLFQVLDRKAAQEPVLDDTLKQKIEGELRRQKEQVAQDAFLAKLKKSAHIVIDEKALAKVR